jgi:hypothetical protein
VVGGTQVPLVVSQVFGAVQVGLADKVQDCVPLVATLPLQVVTVCVPVKLQLLSLVLVQVPVEGVQVVPKFAVTDIDTPALTETVSVLSALGVQTDPEGAESQVQLVRPAVLETSLVPPPPMPLVPVQSLLPLTVKLVPFPLERTLQLPRLCAKE